MNDDFTSMNRHKTSCLACDFFNITISVSKVDTVLYVWYLIYVIKSQVAL